MRNIRDGQLKNSELNTICTWYAYIYIQVYIYGLIFKYIYCIYTYYCYRFVINSNLSWCNSNIYIKHIQAYV